MINLNINDHFVSVPEGTTVLAAAQKLKISIPTLCNHPDLCCGTKRCENTDGCLCHSGFGRDGYPYKYT
jgi:predicted molibdopterin-dependent oxidoreductase YjgC